jgi:hypothetical protein
MQISIKRNDCKATIDIHRLEERVCAGASQFVI